MKTYEAIILSVFGISFLILFVLQIAELLKSENGKVEK